MSAFVCNAATQCAEARINSMNKKKDCIGKHLLNILELLSLKFVKLKPQKVFLFCFSWRIVIHDISIQSRAEVNFNLSINVYRNL